MKREITTPFFIINPKSYLYGKELMELVDVAEQLTKEFPISIFVTCPFADIYEVALRTKNVIVTSQHIDGITPGRGMGKVLPEAVFQAGARATFLNHAENQMTLSELSKAIERANMLNMITIVCADSLSEARAITTLHPDIVLCEPTELIGTGQTSDKEYVAKTNAAIKEVDTNVLVMQAAGISTPEDVYNIISMHADGTGCTSGIVKADDPKQTLRGMVKAAYEASKLRKGGKK